LAIAEHWQTISGLERNRPGCCGRKTASGTLALQSANETSEISEMTNGKFFFLVLA